MRAGYLVLFCCVAIGGCQQPFPTEAQVQAARMAVENDRSERILPAALAGTWISDKGSSITFGPSHKVSADLAGATRHGRYRLEAYKLVIDGRSLGWISLEERDRFLLFTSREQSERFHRVQA